MIRKRVTWRLWDYGVQKTTQVMKRTFTQSRGLCVARPLQDVKGETVDILEYVDFGFYDHFFYKDNDRLGVTSIGRWVEVSH